MWHENRASQLQRRLCCGLMHPKLKTALMVVAKWKSMGTLAVYIGKTLA